MAVYFLHNFTLTNWMRFYLMSNKTEQKTQYHILPTVDKKHL